MTKAEEYLNEIRKAENLSRAILKKLSVEGKTVTFALITDKSYTEGDVAYAEEVSARFVPQGFSAKASVMKSVPSAEGIRRAVADFLKTRYPSAAAFLSPDGLTAGTHAGGGAVYVYLDAPERARFDAEHVLDETVKELNRAFCGNYLGEFRFREKERGEIEAEEIPEEIELAPRYFCVTEYVAIDGGKPERAIYIDDLTREAQGVCVCGAVSFIEERQTKNGKPYFSVTLSDGSGSLRAAYFSKKATLEKVRAVKAGDYVCLSGDNELYNGGLSFRVKAIDFGKPPAGFVPEARPSRPVPARYKKVLPEPDSDLVQGGMFDDAALPEALKKGKFVVFDLETTGLNNTPAGGTMDRIIEVGAVKLIDGKICEKFSTFVACPVRLPEEIISLTGIEDSMLKGAPEISDVIADFFKFCDGCVLVGHNVQFDYKFIRFYGEKEGYVFAQKQYDTVSFSQALLRLSNYKLNTVADYFGFTFRHHRAYDDAFVTAKIFIALCKQKGGLPAF